MSEAVMLAGAVVAIWLLVFSLLVAHGRRAGQWEDK